MSDRFRGGEILEIHVRHRGKDERQPKRRVTRRRPLEVPDRAGPIELDEPVQARDELLVRFEARRLASGRRPRAEARIEQRRERGDHALPYQLHRDERLRHRPADGIERPEDLAVGPVGDLDLELDAVAVPVVRAGDDGPGARLSPERADARAVEMPGAVALPRSDALRLHHRHRRDHFHEPRLREPLGHPVGGHVAQVVERRVARVVLDHCHDHAVESEDLCQHRSSTPARTAKAARATRAAPATAIRRPRRPVSGPREGMLERWLGPPSAAANSSAVANRSSGSSARAVDSACFTARAPRAPVSLRPPLDSSNPQLRTS